LFAVQHIPKLLITNKANVLTIIDRQTTLHHIIEVGGTFGVDCTKSFFAKSQSKRFFFTETKQDKMLGLNTRQMVCQLRIYFLANIR